MKQILFSGLFSLLALLLLPTGQAPPPTQQKAADAVLWIESAEVVEPPAQMLLLDGTEILMLGEEDYLTGVLLCEMPPSFEPEALKAQAVAARTFLHRQMSGSKHENAHVCSSSACCQAWQSPEALQVRYGESYTEYAEKARAAVSGTRDEILLYEGRCIDATYFSCSGGYTEAAVAVWGGDIPYLQSVQSFGEEAAPRFESTVTLPAEDFRSLLLEHAPESRLDVPAEQWLGTVTHTAGKGIDTYVIGGVSHSGTALRHLFGLNSTEFDLTYQDGSFTFHVRGYGHRVGMSQYGANHMAQQGFDYRTILQYYYQGVTIKKTASDHSEAVAIDN